MTKVISIEEYHEAHLPKRGKYKARPCIIDGHRFSSQKEGRDYIWLKSRLDSGEIEDLTLQPSYELSVEGKKIGSYRADFSYYEKGNQAEIVHETKGYWTPLARWKVKHFVVQYPHKILRIT